MSTKYELRPTNSPLTVAVFNEAGEQVGQIQMHGGWFIGFCWTENGRETTDLFEEPIEALRALMSKVGA